MRRDVVFNMIVAVDEEFGFGKDGKIPWNFKRDFQWFRENTNGEPCIMGRRTYEDLLEMRRSTLDEDGTTNPLPNRQIFVLTSNPENIEIHGDTKAYNTLDGVKKYLLKENPYSDRVEAFLCGGRRIYEDNMSSIDKVFVTIIEGNYECDRKLDLINLTKGKSIIHGEKNVEDGKVLTFLIYK